MLTLWRQRQTNASWRQLIEALKQLKLKRVATEIEKLLTGQEYTMQDLKITPMHNQQQDLQTASLQEESSIGMPYMSTIIVILLQSKCSNIYKRVVILFYNPHRKSRPILSVIFCEWLIA